MREIATKDHILINTIESKKTNKIITQKPNETYSFDQHWHTVKSDMNKINPKTLQVVEQTVMEVIYNEK